MNKTPKMPNAYVDNQNTTEIMDAMKGMFQGVLQQVTKSELDNRTEIHISQHTPDFDVKSKHRNYRNWHSKNNKKVTGNSGNEGYRNRSEKCKPQIICKYSRNVDDMEEKT